MDKEFGAVTRRRFFRGAGQFGLGGVLGWLSGWSSMAVSRAEGAVKSVSEYTYDISDYLKTDPALIHYEEAGAIPVSLRVIRALAVGSGERIYAVGDRGVVCLGGGGELLEEIALSAQPRCLAVEPNGELLIGMKDHVEVWDAGGKRKSRWPAVPGKPVFTGLALSEAYVFVADAGNRIVHRYDHTGTNLGEIGRKDSGRGIRGFIVPSPYFDLSWGKEGVLWVVNPGNHQLEAYSAEGELVTSWGKFGTAIRGFCGCCNPVYFARLPDGRFVTSEKGLPRIKVYSAEGEFESVVAGPESFPKLAGNPNASPAGMAVACDARGRVLVADSAAQSIRIFTRKEKL